MNPRGICAAAAARSALLAACLALFVGCAYALVRSGAVNQTKANQIEDGIQRIRQLSFKTRVPVVVESREQAELDMAEELHREYSDQQLSIEGRSGALIGLYPAGIDLKAATLALLKSQVAGFYNPHKKQLILVEGTTDLGFWGNFSEFVTQRDAAGEMLFAHELTHALQDQHFGLEAALDRLKGNDDRALALKALAEGDATLAGFGYLLGRLDDQAADLLVARLSDLTALFTAQSPDTPRGLSVPLLFQYSDGVRFAAEAFRRGGWAGVDALYRDPPQSSQQIRDPALYFDAPKPPVEITLAGYQSQMPAWVRVYENTLGEITVRIILERNLGDLDPGLAVARQWAGDRIVVLQRESLLTVCWLVVFTDERSAQRFAATYASLLDRLLGQRTPHRIDYHAGEVLVLIGESARRFTQLAPALWKETRLQPALPPKLRIGAGRMRRASSAPAGQP